MSDKILKDEDYGTRDKRGNWKPFGKVPINPDTGSAKGNEDRPSRP